MTTNYSNSSQSIRQRINKDVAMYLKEKTSYDIDELLVIAATPAVLSDFKNIELKSMYRVMIKMKLFLKGKQRFLNYNKDSIKKGLAKEWIPILEDDDKVKLLEELAVISYISDDGVIVVKEPFCTTFFDANISDLVYGKADYYAPSNCHPKEIITEVKPLEGLKEILTPYIEWYKRYWKYMFNHEHFKWDATEQFHRVFDLNAVNFADNLKDALSKEEILLSGRMNFSKSMLIQNAEYSREDVRSVLEMLFDESIDMAKRINDFIEQFSVINNMNIIAGHLKSNTTHHQNPHSISVYLAFAHPSRHYIYKETAWLDFKYETELDYPSLYRFSHKLVGYELICNQIREVLISDKELVDLHNEAYPNDLSNYHLLTQDFIHAIGEHFVSFDKRPDDFVEGQDE